jgi:two-component system chemotaxis response regulator CheB
MPITKVLIADDSATARLLMTSLINATSDLQVVGEAHNGQEAVRLTHELRPNVVLMDVVMPRMSGLEATGEIMHSVPTPIVMVSASLESQETDVAFQAIRLGALTLLQKPVGPGHPDHAAQSAALINAIRAMAGVKVIHHRRLTTPIKPVEAHIPIPQDRKRAEIVGIAVSTGGPAALSEIIKGLPGDFAMPIVVVQHISPDFLPSLVEWLGRLTSLKITIAQAGQQPASGHIYFAPADSHLKLTKQGRFELDRTPGRSLFMPSGDILLESIAQSYGARAIGLVLTGMGNDGAHGLRMMRDAGAYTIAQDEGSSVVFGMPKEAFMLGAVCDVMPLNKIVVTLASLGYSARKEQTNG